MMQERNKIILSTLWIFVVLNMFAKDIHEFGRPGMLDQIAAGVVDGVVITEILMLVGGIMFEIPILMVLLSQVLNYPVNRWVNIIVGVAMIGMTVFTNLDPDLDNVFFMVIELLALVGVLGIAIRWRPVKGNVNSASNP